MKLSYQGVNYEDAASTLEVTEGEIAEMFRGNNRQFPYLRHIPEPLHRRDRRHCGISYHPTQSSATEARLVEPPVAVASCQTWPTRKKREILDKMMSYHLLNTQHPLEQQL